MKFAIIENGIVANIVQSNSALAANWIADDGTAKIGGAWNGVSFANPVPTRDELKAIRQARVDAIKVTTRAGNTFDGDEVSQGRMARAIIALQATGTPTVAWVLANNTAIQATAAELTEALALAGTAQAAVWVL